MNEKNVFKIKTILRLFELASGLKVIFLRVALELLGWRAIERCANVLNCKVLTLPFIYLGLLIGANHRRVETCQPPYLEVRT